MSNSSTISNWKAFTSNVSSFSAMPFHPEDEPLKHSLKGKLFEIIYCQSELEILMQGTLLLTCACTVRCNATNFAYLMNKNKSFARSSPAFFLFLYLSSRSRQICDVK